MSLLLHVPGRTALVLMGCCVRGRGRGPAGEKTSPVGNMAQQQMLPRAWFKSSLPALPSRAAQRAPTRQCCFSLVCSTESSLGSSQKRSHTTQYSPPSGRRKTWVYSFEQLDERLDDCNFSREEGSLENPHPAISHHEPPAAQAHEACRAKCFTATRGDLAVLLSPAGTPRHREPVTQLLNHLLKPLGFKRPLGPAQAPGQQAAQGQRVPGHPSPHTVPMWQVSRDACKPCEPCRTAFAGPHGLVPLSWPGSVLCAETFCPQCDPE